MVDFIKTVTEALREQGKTTEHLFQNGIVSKNTFYKYKQRNPSIKTLINIANYLQVSIDCLLEFNDENNFVPYKDDQSGFYDKLIAMIKKSNLTNRQFCAEMNYSRANINRYKNGVLPNLQTLIEIAQYFDCGVDDLLGHQ